MLQNVVILLPFIKISFISFDFKNLKLVSFMITQVVSFPSSVTVDLNSTKTFCVCFLTLQYSTKSFLYVTHLFKLLSITFFLMDEVSCVASFFPYSFHFSTVTTYMYYALFIDVCKAHLSVALCKEIRLFLLSSVYISYTVRSANPVWQFLVK
jgi:hypothetical protein